MADVFLFPSEPNPPDVRLREPGAPAVVHQITVAVAAVVSAAISRTASLSRAYQAAAVAEAATGRSTALSRAHEVIATAVPTVSSVVTPAEEPATHSLAFTVEVAVEVAVEARKLAPAPPLVPGGIVTPRYFTTHDRHLGVEARTVAAVRVEVRRVQRTRPPIIRYVEVAAAAEVTSAFAVEVTPAPVLSPVAVTAAATVTAGFAFEVDRIGRRRQEDDLILIGVL